MTADSRLYCINTTSSTGSFNPYWDTGSGGYSSVPTTPTFTALFDSSATIPSENLSTNNLFGLPMLAPEENVAARNFLPLYSGMTPSFTGDIFNMPLEMPNIDLFNQMFANIMTGFQQQMKNMQSQLMQQMSLTQPYYDEDTSYFSYDAKALKAKWSKAKRDKTAPPLTDGFYNKVVEISKRIGCNPDDLMTIMYSESCLNPQAKSKYANSGGLIGFMDKYTSSLGTSLSALLQMSPEEQLVYVEKFLVDAKKRAKIGSSERIGKGTLYALIFAPARAKGEVMYTKSKDGDCYSSNSAALDYNRDGVITKSELAHRMDLKRKEAIG